MLPYSVKYKKANFRAPYSILNPETNSLSPSAKSNGARFVSARHVINQQISTTIVVNQKICLYFL